jgi:hypothetical protein
LLHPRPGYSQSGSMAEKPEKISLKGVGSA